MNDKLKLNHLITFMMIDSLLMDLECQTNKTYPSSACHAYKLKNAASCKNEQQPFRLQVRTSHT